MKRMDEVDCAKAVGICLIVLSHIFGGMGLGANAVWRWLDPFMVGIFFVMSGYLAAQRRRHSDSSSDAGQFRRYAAKKAGTLLVPYLSFSVAALVIKLGIAHMIGGSLREQAEPAVREFVTFLGTGTLWFLPTLFFAEMLFFGVIRLPRWGKGLVLATSVWVSYAALPVITAIHYSSFYEQCGTLLIWGCDYLYVIFRSLVALGLMILGYEGMPRLERWNVGWKMENESRTGGGTGRSGSEGFLIAISALVTLTVPLVFFPDFRALDFGPAAVLLYVDSLAAAIFFVALFRWLGTRLSLEPIATIGQNSLIIMCTHNEWYLVQIFRFGLEGLLGVCAVIGPRYYLECGAMLVLILMTEQGLCDVLNRYAGLLIGRRTPSVGKP